MRNLHEWNLSHAEAWRVQVALAGRVEFVPPDKEPQVIAGFDCAFSGHGKRTFAAAVVLRVVVRTRSRVKPVFVSVGHRSMLEEAIRITLACATRYRIPEPTRLAHQAVSKLR